MATDGPTGVRPRNARPLAQGRNERFVQVGFGEALGPVTEQELHALACFGIDEIGLCRPDRLPGGNGLANEWIDRFSKCSPGFVDRNVKQADRSARLCFCRSHYPISSHDCLHACAPHSQAREFVTAQSCEEPEDGKRADHLQRVIRFKCLWCLLPGRLGPTTRAMMSSKGTILSTKVETGPQELGPEVIANRAWCHPYLVFEAAWGRKHPLGIETFLNPSPLLCTAEAATKHTQKAMLSRCRPGFAWILERNVQVLTTEISNAHLVHRRYHFGSQFAREVCGRCHLWMVYCKPPSQTQQIESHVTATGRGSC